MTSPVKEGEIVAGRYRVDRVLGIGGMGVVVAATDERLGAQVAIKFLLAHALAHPEIVARFAREARAAVRIKSEHVARVMDVGTLESGAPYMVMEYLQGRDLASGLETRGRLSMDDAIDYVLQASEALVEAHQLGFVHRDLKPANLFLVDARGAPIVKVLDFGISKMGSLGGMTGSGAAVTQTASLLGSPLYMSPEQMDSARNVDRRTDVWALGVILYELLSGNPPFIGESIPQLCIAIMSHAPAPLRDARPEVPPRLEAVVLRCLEKNRESRFASVDELALALAEFAPPRSRLSLERINTRAMDPNLADSHAAASNPARAATSGVPAGSVDSGRRSAPLLPGGRADSSTQATWGRTAAERGSPYVRWAAVAVPTVIALGLGAAFFVRSNAASSEHTPTAPTTSVAAASRASAAELTPSVTPSPPAIESGQPASPPAVAPVPAISAAPVSAAAVPAPAAHVVQRGHATKGKPVAATLPAAPPPSPSPVTPPPPSPLPANNAPPPKPRPTDSWEDDR